MFFLVIETASNDERKLVTSTYEMTQMEAKINWSFFLKSGQSILGKVSCGMATDLAAEPAHFSIRWIFFMSKTSKVEKIHLIFA